MGSHVTHFSLHLTDAVSNPVVVSLLLTTVRIVYSPNIANIVVELNAK